MKNLAKILFLVFIFFVFTAPSTADIKSAKIRNDDRDHITFEEFEFTHTGHVSVAISAVSVTSMPVTSNLSRPDLSRIGFYLVSDYADSYMNDEHISCDLDSKFITLLFTFQDLSHSSFNKSFAVTYPNLYKLRFANCNLLSHVTMDVRTELYNTINGSPTRDYLSAGQTNLPSLYFQFSLIYMFSLAFWICVCLKNHRSFHWIHMLMGVLLLAKGFNLLCAYKVQLSIKNTGIPPHEWNVLLYVFQFIRNVLFYTVIAVIVDGYWFLNPDSSVKIGLIFVIIPLQVLATIASKKEREGLFEEMWNWVIGFWFAETFCNVVFIFLLGSVVCKMTSDDQQAVKLLNIMFLVYTCVDIVVCGPLGIEWVKTKEIVSVVFYMVMFFLFRPSEKNEYFVLLKGASAMDVELGCGVI